MNLKTQRQVTIKSLALMVVKRELIAFSGMGLVPKHKSVANRSDMSRH